MRATPTKFSTTKNVCGSALLAVQLLAVMNSLSCAQESISGTLANTNLGGLTSKQRYEALKFTTPAYRREALRLLIEEANRVAREPQLPEKLPIAQSDLLEAYISPPRMSQALGTFGTVTTSNYIYCVSVANKFSFLVKRKLEAGYAKLKAQYLWPMSRLNTNAAFQLATQILVAASMDVEALQRDCTVRIRALTPEGPDGKHFVPVYSVTWVSKRAEGEDIGMGSGASIELLEPTREIRQLHVLSPEYILRKPLEIQSLESLLSQTNAAPQTTTQPMK
jgi:hypothetical protein